MLKSGDRLTIGYAGGLHYGYGEQLAGIAPILRRTKSHVQVFGASPSARQTALCTADDVFTFHGRLDTPAAAWSAIANSCDAILLPYANPPGAFALQYRTHFPSKLGWTWGTASTQCATYL